MSSVLMAYEVDQKFLHIGQPRRTTSVGWAAVKYNLKITVLGFIQWIQQEMKSCPSNAFIIFSSGSGGRGGHAPPALWKYVMKKMATEFFYAK